MDDQTWLCDMELPPQVVRIVDEACAALGETNPEARAAIEEDLKLKHYYGGRQVGLLETPRGLRVLGAVAYEDDFLSSPFAEGFDPSAIRIEFVSPLRFGHDEVRVRVPGPRSLSR